MQLLPGEQPTTEGTQGEQQKTELLLGREQKVQLPQGEGAPLLLTPNITHADTPLLLQRDYPPPQRSQFSL